MPVILSPVLYDEGSDNTEVEGEENNSTNNTTTYSSANNDMTMRSAGAYQLFINSDTTIDSALDAGGDSWHTTYDSTKKISMPMQSNSLIISLNSILVPEIMKVRIQKLPPLWTDGSGDIPLLRQRCNRYHWKRYNTRYRRYERHNDDLPASVGKKNNRIKIAISKL
jgi:hypothetical protein